MKSLLRNSWTAPVAGLAALLILAILLILRDIHVIYLIATGVGSVSIITYLLLRKRMETADTEATPGSWGLAGTVILLIGAVISWLARPDTYVIPTAYYVLTALASGSLFIYARTGSKTWPVVVLSCIILLLHVCTINLMFPGLLGLDTWQHQAVTTTLGVPGVIGYNGNLENTPPLIWSNIGGYYSLMYFYLRSVMTVLGINYATAALLFWSAPQAIVTVVLAYLVGRSLWSNRVGAIAAIVIAGAGWVIFFGQWSIPCGMGVVLGLLAAWVVINSYLTKRFAIMLWLLPILLTAITINIIAAVWVIGIIATASIPLAQVHKRAVAITLAITASICALWYVSSFAKITVTTLVVGSLNPSIGLTYAIGAAPIAVSMDAAIQTTNLLTNTGELLVNVAGMLLFLGMAIIGSLAMIKRNPISKYWVILCAGVLLISFVPPIFGMSVVEHRWYYLGEALMAIPLAVFLARLSRGWKTVVLSALLVAVTAFLSTIGAPANTTNRLLSPNLVVRYSLTTNEMQGADAAYDLGAKLVGADPLYALFLNSTPEFHNNVFILDDEILCGDFLNCKADTLILRDSLYKEPFGYGSGAVYRLTFDPAEYALNQGYKEVWSNSEVRVLMKGDLP